MWSRSALRIASYGRTYGVTYRSFTSNSLQKRALQALGNKQQPSSSVSTENNDKPTLDKDKTSPPLNENRKENDEKPLLNQESSVSSPKPIMAATSSNTMIPPPPSQLYEFAPRIVVCGVGGGGGNAINNMISKELQGKVHTIMGI